MLPSPYGCRLGPRGYSLSRPQCVHCCYGPVTRGLPWGGLVDRLQSFSFHHLCYPNYGALTLTPAGLSPAEHASLRWTHNRATRLSTRTCAAATRAGDCARWRTWRRSLAAPDSGCRRSWRCRPTISLCCSDACLKSRGRSWKRRRGFRSDVLGPTKARVEAVASGWAPDGAVQDRIDDTVTDGV